MNRIIVGVDGSECSLKALSMAATLAKPLDAEITVAYVIAPKEYAAPYLAPASWLTEAAEAAQSEGKRIVGSAVVAARNLGATARARVLEGPPAEVLAEVAENEAFDLVVVGSRGQGAVKRLLLGSTSDRLVHACTRPVLVVR